MQGFSLIIELFYLVQHKILFYFITCLSNRVTVLIKDV